VCARSDVFAHRVLKKSGGVLWQIGEKPQNALIWPKSLSCHPENDMALQVFGLSDFA
jgi:hypothetical protein